jgi:putative integral membrane protein (TIGR02587 family)
MAVGCAVLAYNVAPTEEIAVLAGRVGDLQAAGVAGLSLVGLHAIVYSMGFRGQHRSDAPVWSVFLGYTVVGYAVTLLVCSCLLWVFGHLEGVPLSVMAVRTVILGVPGTIGAGAARLLL